MNWEDLVSTIPHRIPSQSDVLSLTLLVKYVDLLRPIVHFASYTCSELSVGQLLAVFEALLLHPSCSSLDVMHSCTRANVVAVRFSYIVMEYICQSKSEVLNYNSL